MVILTGDKDIFQLITDSVFVAAPQLGLANIKIFDKSEVEKKLDVSPNQIVEYKALVGDSSDNYPGVQGIGPVGAIKFIDEFGDFESIFCCCCLSVVVAKRDEKSRMLKFSVRTRCIQRQNKTENGNEK